jgi:hypothetical protein
MRLLGVNASTVRKAIELRVRTEREKRWVPIVAGRHQRIDPQPLIDWSGPGSTIDKSRKIEVKVEGAGTKHPLRYAEASNRELRQRFLESEEYKQLNAPRIAKILWPGD